MIEQPGRYFCVKSHVREVAHGALNLFLMFSPLPGPGSTASAQSEAQAVRATNGEQQTEQYLRPLEPGKPVEREMAGGESHSYQLTVASGQYLHVVVAQRGIDLEVVIFGPDSRKLAEVNNQSGTRGAESVSIITEASGNHRVEVRPLPKSAAAGRYEVRIAELRPASAQDENRLAAQKCFSEGERLRAQGTPAALQKAIVQYQQAVPLWRAAGERRREASTFYNIGLIYDSSGEMQKALDYFNQALLLFRAENDRQREANTLHNIGRIYNSTGEKQKALDHYHQALLLKRAENDRRGEANTLNSIGVTYFSLGDNERALDHLSQALRLRQTEGNQEEQASILNNLGLVYDSSGEKQKALDYFHQALRLRQTTGSRRGEANALGNIARVYSSLGEKQKALDYYNQALLIFRASADHAGEATTLHNLGAVYAPLGENQKALDHYSRALMLRRAMGDRQGEASTLHNIAMVYQSLDKLSEALAHSQAALYVVESLRSRVASQELRSSYFASAQKYYELNIDLLMQLHKQRPSEGHALAALEISERARVRSLLETLTEARADIRHAIDPSLLQRERLLQRQLNARAESQMRLLRGEHTEKEAAGAEKELKEYLAQYQDVQGQIRATSPRYAALTQPQPLTVKEIQQQALDENTLLLEYALGSERSHLWAVSPGSITSYELPPRADVEAAARRAYELLTARQLMAGEAEQQWRARISQAEAEYQGVAAALSELLLGPVTSLLGNKRLVIVADGALQYVPFAALPKPEEKGEKGKWKESRQALSPSPLRRSPLIVNHAIISLPSASVLAVLRQETAGRKPVAGSVVVLADPVFDKDDDRVARQAETQAEAKAKDGTSRTAEHHPVGDLRQAVRDVGITAAGSVIPRLPFSRQEADAIVASAPAGSSMKALNFKASRATATSADLGKYRIIHFATHGLLNARHPELSGVVLSLVDEQGQPQDGFLRLHEIYNLDLPAELVVLSACQTALGKEIRGEGVVGLVRGFMYAGAPRVVASLWKVDDSATAKMMEHFYRGMLKEGLRPAEALRRAQMAMLRQNRWQSPYYWAGFVLLGEWK
jgi:CHAT domain-containing protein/tetratricopeptide (TPR) repeat protein